jgi:hypothetical protein
MRHKYLLDLAAGQTYLNAMKCFNVYLDLSEVIDVIREGGESIMTKESAAGISTTEVDLRLLYFRGSLR